MSELRVALVAEGVTDLVIIEAALRALLPRPFTLNLLQPEPTRPRLGLGTRGLPALPCSMPCPPPEGSANEVRARIVAWLGMEVVGPKTVLCVPSKASEAWLAAAVLDGSNDLLQGLECNRRVEAGLAALPKATRIKKTKGEYLAKQAQVTAAWGQVRQRCTQADRFSTEVQRVCAPQRHPARGPRGD